MSPAEFADLFRACPEGRQWAVANCATMDDAWATARPDWLLWIATQPGVIDDATLVRFAEWSGFAWNRSGVMQPREIALRASWSALGKSVIETAGDRSWSDELASKIKANRSSVYASQAAWLRANTKPDWERARKMGGAR